MKFVKKNVPQMYYLGVRVVSLVRYPACHIGHYYTQINFLVHLPSHFIGLWCGEMGIR